MSEPFIKANIPLRIDQHEKLTRISMMITAKRKGGRDVERITKGSIIRALLDSFDFSKVDLDEIKSEDELRERIKQAMGKLNCRISNEDLEKLKGMLPDRGKKRIFNTVVEWLKMCGYLELEHDSETNSTK